MRRTCCSLMIFSFLITTHIWGTTSQGGKGLIYVHSARVIPKGYLEFYGGTRFYGKIANFGGASKAYTLWNVQGFTSFNYGLSPHIELAVSPILYQDTNSNRGNILEGQANFPDDILLSVKVGSMGALESPYLFGGMLYTRIPTAQQHNIIYEPYSAGSIELGFTGLISYFSNTTFPEEGWSIHGNLGYLSHNDVGRELTESPDDLTPQSMSSEILFGIGLLYPAGTFDFSGEITARYFLAEPPITAYSREYVSYLTAGVYYKPYPWVTFKMGIDVRFISEQDLSEYSPVTQLSPPPTEDFPNYPSWRGLLGVKLAILPTYLRSSSEKVLLERKALDRRAVLERMMREQQDTKDAESELARIRAERKKVEEELMRLRKLLEAEKKKKKEKKE